MDEQVKHIKRQVILILFLRFFLPLYKQSCFAIYKIDKRKNTRQATTMLV